MKRPLRFTLALLLLLAILTLLSSQSALLRGSEPEPESESAILTLASADVTGPDLTREVDDLLHGNLPNARTRRHRTMMTDARYRIRNPIDDRILPEFRRSLLNWIRTRRFDPRALSVLPERFGLPRLHDTCAVVGNSGILLKSDHGTLIDGHDFVVRLNNARTHGYARHVGSKTNLSFVNSNVLHLCARRPSCSCHPYGERVPVAMYVCQPAHFLDYVACNASHEAPLRVTDSSFDVLCARIVKYYSLKRFVESTGSAPEEWSKFHDEKMFHYSSGMQAVVLAAGLCRTVSVFGFGKSGEANHHYHTNQKAELDLHDYEAEYAFYRDLAERPEVIPFLKDSEFKVPPVVFYH